MRSFMAIKKCPFCNGRKTRVNDIGGYAVVCDICACRGPIGYSRKQAIERWNKAIRETAKID